MTTFKIDRSATTILRRHLKGGTAFIYAKHPDEPRMVPRQIGHREAIENKDLCLTGVVAGGMSDANLDGEVEIVILTGATVIGAEHIAAGVARG